MTPTVGATVRLHRRDGSGLWDRRPWRVARVGPQYPHGLAIVLEAGPKNRTAVGSTDFTTYLNDPPLANDVLILSYPEPPAQLDMWALLTGGES